MIPPRDVYPSLALIRKAYGVNSQEYYQAFMAEAEATRPCDYCGVQYVVSPTNRTRHRYCTPACRVRDWERSRAVAR